MLERIDDATRSGNTFWLMMPLFEVGVLRDGASAFGLDFVLLRGRVSRLPLQLDWEIWSAESTWIGIWLAGVILLLCHLRIYKGFLTSPISFERAGVHCTS